MTSAELLLAATLVLPLAMLAACLSCRIIERAPVLLALAPLPALAAALVAPTGTTLVLPDALLRLTFVLDRPAAMQSSAYWIAELNVNAIASAGVAPACCMCCPTTDSGFQRGRCRLHQPM